jgi:hypothetical protein
MLQSTLDHTDRVDAVEVTFATWVKSDAIAISIAKVASSASPKAQFYSMTTLKTALPSSKTEVSLMAPSELPAEETELKSTHGTA